MLLMMLTALLVGAGMPAPAPGAAQDTARVVGRVVAADGGSVARARARVVGEWFEDAVPVDSAGGFSLPLPRVSRGDSVDLVVEAGEGYHRALARVAVEDAGAEHGFVLVPRGWTVPSGAYAGARVEIDLRAAFTPVCRGCSGFYRRGSPHSLRTWPGRAFPLRVAFDREWSGARITARDSAAFWRVVEEMEEVFGSDLFRPAPIGETFTGEESPEDVILVVVDPSLRSAGLGMVSSLGSDITFGEVYLKWPGLISDPREGEVVLHELVHTLGLGHTCSWRSIMAVPSRCPGLRASTPTPEDVAHAQLLQRVRELQRTHGARWGLDAALAALEAALPPSSAAFRRGGGPGPRRGARSPPGG